MEAFDAMAAKDRARGWVKFGYALPPVWPMRADPMNIVFRHGKPRMTIDKTMRLVAEVFAYNECVDLESQPSIEYVSVSMLGRATAILLTSFLRVRVWGFDLEAYFRKTGKQRADVWMSGFVHSDCYGADERVQFGQREAPVLTGRQSCFIVWAIRRELRRLDREYPPTDPALCAWLLERRCRVSAAHQPSLQMQMFGVVPPEVRISSAGGDVRCLQRKSLGAADVPGELRKTSRVRGNPRRAR